ncbi:hypothetical protein ACG2OD_23325 [Streptomyces sp. PDY-4]|uniref:hypothetical protein n=1 Tax=Streptomyces sp. PDY-4 TaxID=3376070 RepID=UPI00379AF75E
MSMFNQPSAGGGFFKPADANGHLVLVTAVHEIAKRFDQLRNEEIDQAVVDLVDLDTPEQELRERINVTHKGIVSRLTAGGGMVLGRIGQVATNSGFQAWALLPFAEGSDDVRAGAWVTAHQPTFTQAAAPAPAAAAPAPAPQPAAVPASPPAQYAAPAPAPAAQYAAPAPAAAAPGDEPPF